LYKFSFIRAHRVVGWKNTKNYSVEDPDPGSGAFLTPGSGMDKKTGNGSGTNNPNHISENLEAIF
jgi:hypothetical protein